jgi:hypothetical protein
MSEMLQGRDGHARPAPQLLDRRERLLAPRQRDQGAVRIGEPLGEAQAEPHRDHEVHRRGCVDIAAPAQVASGQAM